MTKSRSCCLGFPRLLNCQKQWWVSRQSRRLALYETFARSVKTSWLVLQCKLHEAIEAFLTWKICHHHHHQMSLPSCSSLPSSSSPSIPDKSPLFHDSDSFWISEIKLGRHMVHPRLLPPSSDMHSEWIVWPQDSCWIVAYDGWWQASASQSVKGCGLEEGHLYPR